MVRARKPSVSGPGAMSQRTDLSVERGGEQPTRVASGGDYGDRQAMEAQQGAAPMQQYAPPGLTGGAFGATGRPGEPITQGVPVGAGMGPTNTLEPDPDMVLRAMVRKYGHPDLIRLLERRKRMT